MSTTRIAWKALLATAASLSLLCMLVGAAYAAPAHPDQALHAKVLTANPAIDSTIAQIPAQVTVFTAEEMNPDPAKSNLQVYGPGTDSDATDILISTGNAQISLSDPKQMSIAITPTSGHSSGVYIVFWKTVSAADGDAASGSFSFTVNPTTGSSSTPVPGATAAPSVGKQGNNSTASAGAPVWVPIVSAIVALLIGLGAGLGLGRRKPARSSLASMRSSLARDPEKDRQTTP